MGFGKIKADTTVPLRHVIPDEKLQAKSDTRRARKAHTSIILGPE